MHLSSDVSYATRCVCIFATNCVTPADVQADRRGQISATSRVVAMASMLRQTISIRWAGVRCAPAIMNRYSSMRVYQYCSNSTSPFVLHVTNGASQPLLHVTRILGYWFASITGSIVIVHTWYTASTVVVAGAGARFRLLRAMAKKGTPCEFWPRRVSGKMCFLVGF